MCASYGLDPRFSDQQLIEEADDELMEGIRAWARRNADEAVRPYLPLAETLGRMFGALNAGTPDVLTIEYQGELADHDTRILTLSALKGLFGSVSDEPVSFVNAPRMAAERGLEVRDVTTATSEVYVNLITLSGSGHSIAATLVELQLDGLGIDYMQRRAGYMNGVTLDEVKAVAKKLLSADPAILVVGPPLKEASKG